ncbi:pyridoxamine 5'-phosphate oxidase [Legionella sp. W05-934-2]|uniref:pyridoxamine 5'-phosphate oxidase n=1 Tax=Legionella sp. W05-934-2 TaxID=1198649 RepID=UPI0034618907
MADKFDLSGIRRDYGQMDLLKANIQENPFAQFQLWFDEVLKKEHADPTAMTIATVDEHGQPDLRVVLLKEVTEAGFVFYSNYDSVKAHQLTQNPRCALNFFWPDLARQVRIHGYAEKVSVEKSDKYFASRPKMSQISAWVSHQSEIVENRKILETRFKELIGRYESQTVPRPDYWGGYIVIPNYFEFWQGRDCRLHDRLSYRQDHGQWICERLSP